MITKQFRREFNQAQREALSKGMQCVVYCTPAFKHALNRDYDPILFSELTGTVGSPIFGAVFYAVEDQRHPAYRIVIV